MLILKYIRFIISKLTITMVYHHYKLNKKFKSNRVLIGYGASIKNSELGLDVFVGQNTRIVNTIVGDHTYFNSDSQISNTTIGKFCSIGSNVKIGIGSHPIHMVSTHPAFYSNNKGFRTFADQMYYNGEFGVVSIGNDVWIGSDVSILNNIKIGNGSIIAIGSIVTKDVPDYAIVAGIPAKIIKYRFEKDKIQKLSEIKWWEFDSNTIERDFRNYLEVDLFLDENDKNQGKTT